MSRAKMAEPTEMRFGTWTRMGQRKHVLGGDAHQHYITNTTELSMCGSNMACCHITLTTCYYCYLTIIIIINIIFISF